MPFHPPGPSQQVDGGALVGPPNVTGFSMDQTYWAMVSQAYANAVFYMIHRHLNDQGRSTAWNACVALADVLLPTARDGFGARYGTVLRAWEKREYRPDDAIRRLFLLCEIEMRETGKLGKEKLPVSEHNPLTASLG